MSVTIYVEGGGDGNNATGTACRKGFRIFFEKMLAGKDKPNIVACGGRDQAFSAFKTALSTLEEGEHAILLVDSEGPVEDKRPWAYLREREGDKWKKPDGATDDQVHFMVQCMESWFLADPDTLAEHYGQGFKMNLVPRPAKGDVETIPKAKVDAALKSATKGTAAQNYHKTKHAFKILASIDPGKVCQASRHAKRLRERLKDLLPDRAT